MMSRSISAFAVALLLVLFAATASAAAKAPLRIAYIDPLSGPFAVNGVPILDTLKFDAARINKEGGINGHQVEIAGFDDKLNPQKAVVQFHKAVNDGYRYITQTVSSVVTSALLHAVVQYNQRNPSKPVLYLDFANVDMPFTNQRCSFWFFRFGANNDMIIKALTNWIATDKNIHKVFLLNQNYSFGHNLAKGVTESLKKNAPNIKIVGDAFIPLNKVKDFAPYIAQISASGADTVVTGNYGSDMTLLIKAAAQAGLKAKFLTYYGFTVGTVSTLGKGGVGRLYLVDAMPRDYAKHPILAERNIKMYKETGYNYGFLRATSALEMLKVAAKKAHSIEPTNVAFALEGLHYDSLAGPVVMRAKDHQILRPLYISVLAGPVPKKYGVEGTDFGYHLVAKFTAQQTALPTTCHMRRPARP